MSQGPITASLAARVSELEKQVALLLRERENARVACAHTAREMAEKLRSLGVLKAAPEEEL